MDIDLLDKHVHMSYRKARDHPPSPWLRPWSRALYGSAESPPPPVLGPLAAPMVD